MSQHILQLRDSGRLDKLYDKWFRNNNTECDDNGGTFIVKIFHFMCSWVTFFVYRTFLLISGTNKYEQATVQGMKTVLKASALGMVTAIVVLIFEWFVAVHWDIKRDKRQLKRRADCSTSYLDLMKRNILRRLRNMLTFVLKSLGVDSPTSTIDVNIQPVEEDQTIDVQDRD